MALFFLLAFAGLAIGGQSRVTTWHTENTCSGASAIWLAALDVTVCSTSPCAPDGPSGYFSKIECPTVRPALPSGFIGVGNFASGCSGSVDNAPGLEAALPDVCVPVPTQCGSGSNCQATRFSCVAGGVKIEDWSSSTSCSGSSLSSPTFSTTCTQNPVNSAIFNKATSCTLPSSTTVFTGTTETTTTVTTVPTTTTTTVPTTTTTTVPTTTATTTTATTTTVPATAVTTTVPANPTTTRIVTTTRPAISSTLVASLLMGFLLLLL